MSTSAFIQNPHHLTLNLFKSLRASRPVKICVSLALFAVVATLLHRPASAAKIAVLRKMSINPSGSSLLSYVGDFPGERRPAVYTYYRNVNLDGALQNNHMLWTWAYLWAEAGYDPRVLTLDDARKHNDFAKHVADGLSIEHGNRVTRYLAMSSVTGGGWYMDYHVFPLRPNLNDKNLFNLPNDGKFTTHDRHVPSIMSANQWEWNRIAHVMLERQGLNDMQVLYDMHMEDPRSYVWEYTILKFKDLINLDESDSDLCELSKDKRALRFAPEDIAESDFGEKKPHDVVMKFVMTWREKCLQDNVPEAQATY